MVSGDYVFPQGRRGPNARARVGREKSPEKSRERTEKTERVFPRAKKKPETSLIRSGQQPAAKRASQPTTTQQQTAAAPLGAHQQHHKTQPPPPPLPPLLAARSGQMSNQARHRPPQNERKAIAATPETWKSRRMRVASGPPAVKSDRPDNRSTDSRAAQTANKTPSDRNSNDVTTNTPPRRPAPARIRLTTRPAPNRVVAEQE